MHIAFELFFIYSTETAINSQIKITALFEEIINKKHMGIQK
jgi:hypothetical protein